MRGGPRQECGVGLGCGSTPTPHSSPESLHAIERPISPDLRRRYRCRGNLLPFESSRFPAYLWALRRPRPLSFTHTETIILTMHLLAGIAFFASLRAVVAHGDHGHDGPKDGETIAQYAERHVRVRITLPHNHTTYTLFHPQMASEHHMCGVL